MFVEIILLQTKLYVIGCATIFTDCYYGAVVKTDIAFAVNYSKLLHRNACQPCCQAQEWRNRIEQVLL